MLAKKIDKLEYLTNYNGQGVDLVNSSPQNMVSMKVGLDVWTTPTGFYHIPGQNIVKTGVLIPFANLERRRDRWKGAYTTLAATSAELAYAPFVRAPHTVTTN